MPELEIEMEVSPPKLCSKCNKNPRGYPDSSNPWCKQCLAKYKGEYDEAQLARERSKGFQQGVEAFAAQLCMEFGRHGGVTLTCSEIEFAIRRAPRPQFRAD